MPGLPAALVYSPHIHPGPPSRMDSEIPISRLSLWSKYSMGGPLILLEIGSWNAPICAPQNSVLRVMHPECTPIILAFLNSVLSIFLYKKTPEALRLRGFAGISALGELRRAAGGLEAVLLTAYNARPLCTNGSTYLNFGLTSNLTSKIYFFKCRIDSGNEILRLVIGQVCVDIQSDLCVLMACQHLHRLDIHTSQQ